MLFQLRCFFFVGQRVLVPLRNRHQAFHCFGAFKYPRKRIIIGCKNRIELMIMAPCASESQAEEGFSHGIDLFIDDVHFHFLLVNFREHLGA